MKLALEVLVSNAEILQEYIDNDAVLEMAVLVRVGKHQTLNGTLRIPTYGDNGPIICKLLTEKNGY